MYKLTQYFFKPLLKYRPEGMEIRDWMDFLFGTTFRTIDTYTVTTSCQLKGLTITRTGRRAANFGSRHIKPGHLVYVRTDSRTPNTIDVEVVEGAKKRTRVFELTALQWQHLEGHLELLLPEEEDEAHVSH